MEKCLLCDQLFLEKETFLGIISIQKKQRNICPDCLAAFEKIGDKHCPTCYRNGCETQCKDCQKWEKEGHIYVVRPEIKTVSRTEKNPKVLTEFYQHGYDLMEQKLDGLLEYLGN